MDWIKLYNKELYSLVLWWWH